MKNTKFNAVLCLLLFGSSASLWAAGKTPITELDSHQIIEKSQISYRAEGGFTGVESYGVIISCVKGKISVMKSIHDPRVPNEPMRKFGEMSKQRYLKLWKDLERQAAFKFTDGQPVTRDIHDEFTVTFNFSVGEKIHQYSAQGLSLPEYSKYQAVRSLIDVASKMPQLWNAHAKALNLNHAKEKQITFETLNSQLPTDR